LSQDNRLETMADKLAVYAGRAGVGNVDLVTDAYHIALRPRIGYLRDVFHPDMLHPARTALILIENAGCRDAETLAAAEVTDTLVPQMQLPLPEIDAALGSRVATLVASVPRPGGDAATLIEGLVTADYDVALIALAERLDHARHLHMREPALWRAYFDETKAVYLPVAQRIHDDLYHRYSRWIRGFERRLS
jgi:(p)ppGpp synthase/HD superfamily hydrolase